LKNQTDFNEALSRKYVEDALKRGYKPFKYGTIQRLGFCLPDCRSRSPKRRCEG
jgi:hypothetical protein